MTAEVSRVCSQLRYDEAIHVQEAPYPQPVECPNCGDAFNELITERIAGGSCPACQSMIRFDRARASEVVDNDTTEQVTLTDGGRSSE